ncbi:MAG: WG repeat-containing protein [Acidobacteria bacterium]|nr:WG repeat-containing protein [Acidobacteriota bacterium]
MYFWLSLLALAVVGNGHRMAQRWQRSHRSSTVALHGFGSVQARDILRLEAYETSEDPEKLRFTFSYDNYTDWGGNSRCSGYLYLYLLRPGSGKAFSIEFDGDRRLVAEMAGSLIINSARLEQHFRNIPRRAEPQPAPVTVTRFRISSGMFGYHNSEGKEVLAPQYSMAAEFRDGLALVIWGGVFGAIDMGGRFLWKLPAEGIESFTEFRDGKATVRFGQWEEIRSGPHGLEREDVYVTSERVVDREGRYLD